MDKSRLKVFALEGRKELISKVKNRFEKLGINKKGIDNLNIQIMGDKIEIDGELFSKSSYDNLINKYNQIGYDELVEESAYIWFNRLVALAFMESNDYIEERFIFSDGDKINPEIIDNYYTMDFFDELEESEKNKIHNLKDKNTNDSIDEMYSILLEEKCFELSKIMPFMFDKKGGYADILFPENLLMPDSFLMKLREVFEDSKEYNESKDEKIVPVEIIGWLYQYYNQEKREVVYDGTLKKSKISKEYVAPATQLFTPHWIVKYMAENSLGKLAIENCGVSEELKENWKYYIKNSDSEKDSERLNIEDIKIIDPAMGSGHMLTYCFDLLMEIYDNLGWGIKDSVISILKNNIYGLEIDKRAGQLASFAIFMKGREYFSRLFKVAERENINLNTFWIDESDEISDEIRKIIYENSLKNLETLLDNFTNAKEYGSILKIPNIDMENLNSEIEKLDEIYHSQGQLSLMTGDIAVLDFGKEYEKIKKLVRQQEIFQNRFDIVITNPPYMGNVRMNPNLKKYIEKYYPDVKSDLFAVFIKKCYELTNKNKFIALVTPYVWWFIKSYEELRKFLLKETTFDTLIQLEYNAFEGACIPVGTFILRKEKSQNHKMDCIKLSEFRGSENQPIKTLEAIENPNCGWRYKTNQKDFEKIPGSPIAYWVSDRVREIFIKGIKLENISKVRKGIDTGNNDLYMRYWQEVEKSKFATNIKNFEKDCDYKKIKWVPYNKGGSFRKWYGNQEYILNWKNNGEELKNFKNSNLRSKELYFKKSLSWTLLSSSNFGLRYYPNGFIFDSNGSSIFFDDDNEKNFLYVEGILLSKIAFKLLQILSSTMAFNIGDLAKFPIYLTNESTKKMIDNLVQQNINIAKEEWDSRETSWDFEKLFIANGFKISDSYKNYCNHWTDNFVQMHKNEEELNKLFIDIYELNDEMDEKVPFEDITLLKNETKITEILTSPSIIDDTEEREKTSEGYLYNRGVNLEFNKEEIIKQFLSYAVGCIMGRYSIDKNGLIMANSDDVLISSDSLLLIKDREGNIRHEIENPRFLSDDFGIIPITSENVFANDIVTKVFDFVKALYGEENFEENINFICEALGKKENDSCENILRNYFIKDFYTDHLKRYQKRPIYWLFNSGKKNGFQALVYLHRYQDDTMGRLRAEYLLPYQEKMENLKDHYERIIEDESTVARDRKTYEKALKELNGMLLEIKNFANDVKHIVEQRISIDLDDGVKVNYEKFGSVLKKI